MYERMVEGIVYLLIPFYNEFKSLALLFLILTRARVRICRLSPPQLPVSG